MRVTRPSTMTSACAIRSSSAKGTTTPAPAGTTESVMVISRSVSATNDAWAHAVMGLAPEGGPDVGAHLVEREPVGAPRAGEADGVVTARGRVALDQELAVKQLGESQAAVGRLRQEDQRALADREP